ANQGEQLDRGHEHRLAVLVQAETLLVAEDLGDLRDQLGGHHRQIVAGAVVGEVIVPPAAHGTVLLYRMMSVFRSAFSRAGSARWPETPPSCCSSYCQLSR